MQQGPASWLHFLSENGSARLSLMCSRAALWSFSFWQRRCHIDPRARQLWTGPDTQQATSPQPGSLICKAPMEFRLKSIHQRCACRVQICHIWDETGQGGAGCKHHGMPLEEYDVISGRDDPTRAAFLSPGFDTHMTLGGRSATARTRRAAMKMLS